MRNLLPLPNTQDRFNAGLHVLRTVGSWLAADLAVDCDLAKTICSTTDSLFIAPDEALRCKARLFITAHYHSQGRAWINWATPMQSRESEGLFRPLGAEAVFGKAGDVPSDLTSFHGGSHG